MKAIVQPRYGAPSVLELQDIDKPIPSEGEVLVRVHAAGLNIGDWHLLRGIPYVVRLVSGLRGPRQKVPGLDLAGRVEAVGAGVTQIGAGDAVFGWCRGAFAEYVRVPEGNLALKPESLTFEQAAVVGDSAFTALAAVRDQGRVEPGHEVLINGASGGVGTFAVQIAKSFGARVTGVCGTRNVGLVSSIGADEVIDYTRDDFMTRRRRYDVMLDLVGNRPLLLCRRVLTARGTYVLVGVSDMGRWFGLARQAKALSMSPFVGQRIRVFIAKHTSEDLAALRDLVERHEVTPVIDRRYELTDVAEAFAHQGSGHTRGKVVIGIGHSEGVKPGS